MDAIRLKHQENCVRDWVFKTNLKGVGIAPPGYGKTKVMEIVIEPLIEGNLYEKCNYHIVVLTKASTIVTQLKRELCWEKYINSFGARTTNITFPDTELKACKDIYKASFTFLSKEEFLESTEELHGVYLLIIDEIHEFLKFSLTRNKYPIDIVLEKIKSTAVLGLSGTIYAEERELLTKYLPISFEVTERECIEKGWIAPSIIYNVGIELTEGQQEQYAFINSELEAYSNFFRFPKDIEYVNQIQIKSLSHYGWSCVTGYSTSNDNKGYHIELDDQGNPSKKDHIGWTPEYYCWLVALAHGWRQEFANPKTDEEAFIYDTYYPVFRKNGNSIQLAATKFNELTEKRKQFLYELPQKNTICQAIVTDSEISGKPTLIFTKHRKDADELASFINEAVSIPPVIEYVEYTNKNNKVDCIFEVKYEYAKAIHTDVLQPVKLDQFGRAKCYSETVKDPKQRGQPMHIGIDKVIQTYITGLENGKIKIAVGTMILTTGINIPKLEVVIFKNYDSSPIVNDQGSGRGKRTLHQNELEKELGGKNKTAIIINLYAKDTQEIEWLKSKQKYMNTKPIWINDYRQISVDISKYEDDFTFGL